MKLCNKEVLVHNYLVLVMYCTTSLVITYYLFVWLMFINMYMFKITDSIYFLLYIFFFKGRTFCSEGRFVSVDVLWKDVL